MNRYFPMYHGLIASAPWAVAVERTVGSPKAELLLLCRTESDAAHYARLTSLGQSVDGKQTKVSEGN